MFLRAFLFFPWTAWKESQQWYQMESWIIRFVVKIIFFWKITCSNHSFVRENFLAWSIYIYIYTYTDMTSSNPSRRKSLTFQPFCVGSSSVISGANIGGRVWSKLNSAHDGSENADHRSALLQIGRSHGLAIHFPIPITEPNGTILYIFIYIYMKKNHSTKIPNQNQLK